MRTLAVLAVLIGLALARIERPEEPAPPLERQLKPSDLPVLKPLKQSSVNNMDGTVTQCVTQGVDVIFVIDQSGSIGVSNFQAVRTFLQNVVRAMTFPGPAVGAIEFNTVASNAFSLSTYASQAAIVAALGALPYNGGGTNIASGMNYATQYGFSAPAGNRANVSDVMVVLTDGQDGSNVQAANAAAAAKGIKVIAIGVGPAVSQAQLLQVAGGNPNLVYTLTSFNDLSTIVTTICQQIATACDGNPCQNGGLCTETNNGTSYYCTCLAAYTGPDCEQPVDPCWSNPCQAGSSCTAINANQYTCSCPVGHTGANCEIAFCQNGGIFSCDCPYGYTGVYCEDLIDFCNGTVVVQNGTYVHVDICGDHGVCSSTAYGPVCICDVGWTGPWCDIDVDNCASNPCENGATCENLPGDGYRCCCDPLHTGVNCEDNVDFCEHLQILNGTNGQPVNVPICGGHGTCVTTPSGAMCVCDQWYTGAWCEIEIPFNCTYKNNNTYPHNSTWVDGCDQCECQYGNVQCSHAFWCPQRCAVYNTNATLSASLSTTCPPNQNCIPDNVQCARPVCDFPIGWCFPVGYVMVDNITLPTNPPNGWQWG